MSIRHWVFAVALGLTFSASLGEAQEQVPEAQELPATQQEEAQPLPIPFPIEIVEDQAVTDARQRSDEEARQREVEDLIAQQGMNAATQSMNDATQRMAEYTFWSTIFVFVGTVLLIVTLLLTWQANKAAVRSVKIVGELGEAQLRAYISFGGLRCISHWEDADPEKIFWRLHFNIKNTGATPARKVKVRTHFQVVDAPTEVAQIPPNTEEMDVPIGTGETVGVGSFTVSGSDFGAIKRGEKRFYFLCEVSYGNAINPIANHLFRMGTYSGIVTGDPEKYWDNANPVSVTLPHMRGWNDNS